MALLAKSSSKEAEIDAAGQDHDGAAAHPHVGNLNLV
jgi:hypothetical protein